MTRFTRSLLALLSLNSSTLASPALLKPQLLGRDVCAGNTATTRSQWCNYDIDTDADTTIPNTGVTREYWFDLSEVNVAPDGVPRYAIAINGSIPGPTIVADWGDDVVVHLTNSLKTSTNGTSMHFHGFWQRNNNQNDGVTSITQCATPPGSTITYKWRATQYGSTWYHSHFALQAWEGFFGGIIVNGPATANYDEDLGLVILGDWDHSTVDELWPYAQANGPPKLANGLINGVNVFGEDGSDSQTGHRFNVTVDKDKSYRIRLVNTAVDSHFKFSIDNHTMTVIAADLVPIEPFETTVLSMGMGQRYDVIIKANQGAVADSFWMRAVPQSACSENAMADNIRGILYYGSSTATPTTSSHAFEDDCADMDLSLLVPHIKKSVGNMDLLNNKVVAPGTNDQGMFRWYLNSTTMVTDWGNPTLLQIDSGVTTFEASSAVVSLPEANEWAYTVIQTAIPVDHPIHLHGHDMMVLGQGSGTWDESLPLNTASPMRRDTTMLPGGGWLALAFKTDNPGAWLMHCHIGWHTSEGFGLQFVERRSEIAALLDAPALEDNCAAWNDHQDTRRVIQEDSGI